MPLVIRYIPDRYKTQQMPYKAIENYGTLEFVPDFYKNQQMCNIAVDTYHSTIQFVPEY